MSGWKCRQRKWLHADENTVRKKCRVNVPRRAANEGISTVSVKMVLREHLDMSKDCTWWASWILEQKNEGLSTPSITEESATRVANRPGMAGIVPELTHGVPCPGRGSFCPGNVKINHWAWIYGCSLMSVLYFVSCLSVTQLDLTWVWCHWLMRSSLYV